MTEPQRAELARLLSALFAARRDGDALYAEVERLRAENARLLAALEIAPLVA